MNAMTMRMMSGGAEQDRFDLQWDDARRIFIVAFRGFWDAIDAREFAVHIVTAVKQIEGDPFDAVCDLSETVVQSQEVIALQGQLVSGLITFGMRRLAVVGATPLLMMQVRRVAAPLSYHFADDRDAAVAWLRDRQAGSTR